MQLWFIPIFYAVTSVVGGIVVPRLEAKFLPYSLDLSVSSAQAFLSAVASGMMALTGIVFSIAFVLVQFNAIVYSPRLVVWLARDRTLFHSLGVFVATFMYSLSTLAWVDRTGAGKVPLVSCLLVAAMLIASVLLLSLLVQRLNSLQITQVLRIIGDTGREVIARTYRPRQAREGARLPAERQSLPVALTVSYLGKPAVVTSLDIHSLIDQACKLGGRIVVACAVGDTLIEGTRLLKVYGGKAGISESELRRAVRIAEERTFEQDPKYAIRLLVDIAIKALSPAINDPTTAVQAIDQIEDLLRRLANCDIETCEAIDADGVVRVVYQVPSWNDYLTLAFDEIRQFGSTSIQVIRRLRAALVELAQLVDGDRAELVGVYLQHLDSSIDRSTFDPLDRATARVEDRQGLGISRRSDDTDRRPVAVPRS
jgi:uncharacterized membrane protein